MVHLSETKPLSPTLQAVARGRTCDVLGLTLLHGVRADLLEALRLIPGLGPHLEPLRDEDTWGSEHYRVLDRSVPPVESLFLGADGLVGGDIAAQARRDMLADGLRLTPTSSPDHLGLQLAWLSHLLGAESDALEDGRADLAEALRERQRRALDDHIFRYILPLTEAIGSIESPLYLHLMQALCAVLFDLRRTLEAEPTQWSLPPIAQPLTHPEHGLRDIASWLCIPSRAGIYLTLPAIQRIGRELDIPSGFGRRVDCLESLLHGAVRFEAFPKLIAQLDSHMAQVQESRSRLPVPRESIKPWSERLSATRAQLNRMVEGAAHNDLA